MKCGNCGMDTEAGDHYTFYYGNHIGTRSYRRMLVHNYRIVGSEKLFLCDKCVNRSIDRRVLLYNSWYFVVIAITLSGLLLGKLSLTPVELISGILAGPLIILAWRSGSRRKKAPDGDKLAIRIRKAELKRLGYDSFFARYQAESMGLSVSK